MLSSDLGLDDLGASTVHHSDGDQNLGQKMKAVANSDVVNDWLAHAHKHMTDAAKMSAGVRCSKAIARCIKGMATELAAHNNFGHIAERTTTICRVDATESFDGFALHRLPRSIFLEFPTWLQILRDQHD